MNPNPIPILTHAKAAKEAGIKLKDSCPICVIVVGMAGSGKTTFMTALQRSLNKPDTLQEETDETKPNPIGYCLNLDPATKLVPYPASIDIRDVVDYHVRRVLLLIFFSVFPRQCVGYK